MSRIKNSPLLKKNIWLITIGVALVLAIVLFLSLRISSQATTGVIEFEAESASLGNGTSVESHEFASGGEYVRFSQNPANN